VIAGFKDIRLFAHDDSADRNAACQTLSHRDDVGFDFSPLVSEPLAGATHAALDFVAHHQEVVFVTDFTNAFDDGKIDRDDAAFAENRFKEDSDNIFIFFNDLTDSVKIRLIDKNEAFCIWREIFSDRGIACSGKGGNGASVEGVF